MSNDRIALVTGAAEGLGWEIASKLAREAYRVVLIDRQPAVEQRSSDLSSSGFKSSSYVADFTKVDEVQRLVRSVEREIGRCDILVNNAGVHPKKDGMMTSFKDISLEEWSSVFSVNTVAPFILCQGLIPLMSKHKWGRIVNISSRAARTFSPAAGTHYAASKAALIGMTRSIAGFYAKDGITANCIAPGRIATPLEAQSRADVRESGLKEILVGRTGSPIEVAAAVRFLVSEDAAFITGAVLDVNGGGFMG